MYNMPQKFMWIKPVCENSSFCIVCFSLNFGIITFPEKTSGVCTNNRVTFYQKTNVDVGQYNTRPFGVGHFKMLLAIRLSISKQISDYFRIFTANR